MSVNAPAASAALAAAGGIPLQDVNTDTTKLNALSPEVISRQATVSPHHRKNQRDSVRLEERMLTRA